MTKEKNTGSFEANSYQSKSEIKKSLAKQNSILSDVLLNELPVEKQLDNKLHPYGLPFPAFSNNKSDGIILGPVIGLVTSNTARVLIQTNAEIYVKIKVHGQDAQRLSTHTYEGKKTLVNPNQPFVFELKNLKPSFRYAVSFNVPMFDLINSSFITLPEKPDIEKSPIKMAVVSGNEVTIYLKKPYPTAPENSYVKKYTHMTADSLWKDLYNRIVEECIHYVIHIGNNVDVGFRNSVNQESHSLFTELVENESSEDTCYAAICKRYHELWNEPWTKHVLANCSNIMLLNEADIGKIIEIGDNRPNSNVIRVAEMAFKCYQLYQQALCVNINTSSRSKIQSNFISLTNHIKLLLLDWRTTPTFGMNERNITSLFCQTDIKIIQTGLQGIEEPTAFRDLDIKYNDSIQILVLSTLQITDPRSYIHNKYYCSETNSMIDIFFNWIAEGPKNKRHVNIISGATLSSNLSGAIAEIKRKSDNLKIKEWVVGPVAAKPRGIQKETSFENSKYIFNVRKAIPTNNYAVLTFGMRYNTTDKVEESQIPNTFLVAEPFLWIEYYETLPSKDMIDHTVPDKSNFALLERTILQSTTS